MIFSLQKRDRLYLKKNIVTEALHIAKYSEEIIFFDTIAFIIKSSKS